VAVHFKRWVGLPEHAWLRCNERITRVEALDARRLRITLDRPYALLPDLCAINPTAIRGPGALDREGAFRRPIGSGPFAFVEGLEDGRVLRYRRYRPGQAKASPEFVDLVRLEKTPRDDPIDALLRGEVDAILGSWLVHVDPARADGLRKDPRFQVLTAPGSSMIYLGFKLDHGPTANRELRRRIAAAVDREELVRVVEHGFADPSTGWAAPSVQIWPQGKPVAPAARGNPALERPLYLLPGRPGSIHLAETLAAQLQRAGLPTEVVESRPRRERSGRRGGRSTWDLRMEVTHGVPYDPYTTAVSRFTPPTNQRNAQSPRFSGMDPRITALMRKATATPDDEARYKVYAEIQKLLDEEMVIVPLYAPRRIAVLRRGMPTPVLDHDMYALDATWLTDR
jgi:peptide/nickel transport system substrate-binding protein